MNYEQLNEIASSARKLPKSVMHKTTLRKLDDGSIAIRHHETDVVVARPDGSFVLDTGGWMSLTTRLRLNAFKIWQQKGLLWMDCAGKTVLFRDGVIIKKNGKPANAQSADAVELASKKASRMISKYIRGFCESIKKNGLQTPSGGDCWFCLMRAPFSSDSIDHVISHMEESYYVPSLLLNAAIERRVHAKGVTDIAAAEKQGHSDLAYVMSFRSTVEARRMLAFFFRKRRSMIVDAILNGETGQSRIFSMKRTRTIDPKELE